MAMGMALDIHRHRQTGNMGGKTFNMNSQGRMVTTQALNTDAASIDLSQDLLF